MISVVLGFVRALEAGLRERADILTSSDPEVSDLSTARVLLEIADVVKRASKVFFT